MTKTTKAGKAVASTGMGAAVRDFFTRYFDFKGVSTRAQYWWVALAAILVSVVAYVLIFALGDPLASVLAILLGLGALAIVIPAIALMVRRIHDAGFSAWVYFGPWIAMMVLYAVAPAIAAVLQMGVSIWGLVLTLLPSKTMGNPYRK